MTTQTHADTIDDQLRLLGQLVGTEDKQGRQDMRDIATRERARAAAMLEALRFSAMALESAALALQNARGGLGVAVAMPGALSERAREARAAIALAEGAR